MRPYDVWLPDELTADTELDLVTLVADSLVSDIGKVRAFVVALLQDVDDRQAAIKVNDILVATE